MKTLERTASSSEEEASCSSDEEPLCHEKLQTNARNSDSESEKFESEPSEEESEELESEPSKEESEEPEYEPSEEESEEPENEPSEEESEEFEHEPSEEENEESGDLVSKSVVPVAGGSSKKNDSKGNRTVDNVSQNKKGKEKLKSYDLKFKGSQSASSSRCSLKAKGGGGISKKRCFPRVWSLEDEITLLNSIHEFQLKEGREVGPSSIELFCDLLKGRLSFTKRPRGNKVLRKIGGLKKKYFHTVKSFIIEHDLKMKEIADRVWKRKSSKRSFHY